PPATGAFVLAGTRGTGAGFAANGDEAAFVQLVGGDAVGANVVPGFVEAPGRERIELRELAGPSLLRRIPRHDRKVGARRTLITPLPSHPSIVASKHPAQGAHLAHFAALLVAVLVEA